MKLLVIGTEAGGVPESTADVMKQFSVPVKDALAIANKIRSILDLTPEEMSKMGSEARRFAVKKFDIEKIGPLLTDYAMGNRSIE